MASFIFNKKLAIEILQEAEKVTTSNQLFYSSAFNVSQTEFINHIRYLVYIRCILPDTFSVWVPDFRSIPENVTNILSETYPIGKITSKGSEFLAYLLK